MNRTDLQKLATLRLEEARILDAAGKSSGAYYLCGYAVECALKACIAKRTQEFDFPDKSLVVDSHTHDLQKLVRLAQLESNRLARERASKVFETNWNIVRGWSETSRYESYDLIDSTVMINAVGNANDGILPWLMGHW